MDSGQPVSAMSDRRGFASQLIWNRRWLLWIWSPMATWGWMRGSRVSDNGEAVGGAGAIEAFINWAVDQGSEDHPQPPLRASRKDDCR